MAWSKKDEATWRISNAILLIGLLILGLAALTLIFQVGLWLRFGEWLPLSVTNGLVTLGAEYPITSWRGVQSILDGTPLAFGLLAVGLAVEFVGASLQT